MFIGNLQSKFAISGWTQWMTSFGVMAARLLLQFEALARGDTCYKNTGGGRVFSNSGHVLLSPRELWWLYTGVQLGETLMRNISRPTSHLWSSLILRHVRLFLSGMDWCGGQHLWGSVPWWTLGPAVWPLSSMVCGQSILERKHPSSFGTCVFSYCRGAD